MSKVIPLVTAPYAGDYRSIEALVKKLWLEGAVEIVDHAQDRMEEHSLDIFDVRHVLFSGRVTRHTQEIPGCWRYIFTGKTIDGDRARCVVEVDSEAKLITVFRL